MGNLEKVMQLKQQGQTDPQIMEALKQKGVSPKEIEEALSQSQIKSAVQTTTSQQHTIMQPSMMQTAQPPAQKTEPLPPPQYAQPTQETSPTFQPATMPPQAFQQSYQQEAYPDYQYSEYQPQQSDIETINEIAEQIVDEKTASLKKQISSFTKFKEEIALEVKKLNEKVLKIENTLNELQMAVLRKIGDYGQDIQNIAKEMHSTQDSFSKIINPLTDNIRELQKITGSTAPQSTRPKPKTKSSKPKSGKSSKPKPSFEDYLR